MTAAVLLLNGCNWWPEFGIPAGKHPWGEFNPIRDMQSGPEFQDQEPGGMFYPGVGSQPSDYSFDGLQSDERPKSRALKNPVPITAETLAYGKQMYNQTCAVCHGKEGHGDGLVIGPDKFNAVLPNLTDRRIDEFPDGELYHVISHGFGMMYSYKSQLEPLERWAIIHYIRAMHRAAYPKATDLQK